MDEQVHVVNVAETDPEGIEYGIAHICMNCRWVRTEYGFKDRLIGRCWRNPPTPVLGPGGYESVRPLVNRNDYCALFELDPE